MTSPDIRQLRPRNLSISSAWLKLCLQVAFAAAFTSQNPQATAQVLTPERLQIIAETEQLDPELDNLSGWLKIEVAVLTDTREGTLEAEQWPLFPEVRYPSVARWLTNPALIGQLTARYPEAAIGVDDNGAIAVLLPVPVIATAIPTVYFENANAPITELNSVADADTAQIANSQLTAGVDETDETDNAQTFAIPLEQIDAPAAKTHADANWLANFESLSTPPQSEGGPDYSAENAEAHGELTVSAESPPLPEAFKRHDASMLAEGLATLTKNTGDQLQTVQAWLQPPGASNIPILFDRSGDVDTWPALQGFIEIRRSNDLRLGINFWLNTDGSYLPEGFVVEPPPRAPQQVTIFKPINDAHANSTETPYADTGEDSADLEQAASVSGEPFEFIDPSSGLLKVEAVPDDNPAILEQVAHRAWQWRHLIQVADTRPIEENTVRYFDHPVIKVVATYRELTWGEVYELGAIEAEAAANEAALRAAEAVVPAADLQPLNLPASQVPPGNAQMR